ncbi:ABC transporter permease [Halovivax sp.]|uniref:ABC transporter permease n=1 Tax=Halovivax sp. TaxID=1935978 RepID=UPI0025B925CA|nr:FtsX-like permease family protein [Halovivax sp.]
MAGARLRGQATGIAPGRSLAIVWAVALTVGLLLIVTGMALALADEGTASQHDADVAIEPGDGSTFASVDGVESSRLANASERAAAIESADGVDHAAPVFVDTVAMRAGANGSILDADGPPDDRAQVLAVGTEPPDGGGVVAGVPTDRLESGDDARPGDVVLSEAAAEQLGVEEGDEVTVLTATEPRTLSVAAVESGPDGTPVALVHLEEARAMAGPGAEADALADRMLIWGEEEEEAVAASEAAYPAASIESAGSTDPRALFDDGLALATSLVAMVVGVTVCALFVATTAGMAVAEDRRTLAVLAAVGFSRRSRLAVVAVATLATVVLGALVGVAVGAAGILAVDAVVSATVASGSVAAFHPLFVPYAVAVALLAGLLAVPYPLAIAAGTDVLSEVGR